MDSGDGLLRADVFGATVGLLNFTKSAVNNSHTKKRINRYKIPVVEQQVKTSKKVM